MRSEKEVKKELREAELLKGRLKDELTTIKKSSRKECIDYDAEYILYNHKIYNQTDLLDFSFEDFPFHLSKIKDYGYDGFDEVYYNPCTLQRYKRERFQNKMKPSEILINSYYQVKKRLEELQKACDDYQNRFIEEVMRQSKES